MFHRVGLCRFHAISVVLSLLILFLNSCSTSEPSFVSPEEQLGASNIQGLIGAYFNGATFEGNSVTRVDGEINFDWGDQAPIAGVGATGYSVRWTGQVQPDADGNYTFPLITTGQARLWVNGIIATKIGWSDANEQVRRPVDLKAGIKYDLTLEYKPRDTGGSAIHLEWRQGSGAASILPSAQLSPTGSSVDDALATLAATTGFQDLQAAFDVQSAFGTLTPKGFSVIVKEEGHERIFVAILKSGAVKFFIRYGEAEGQGELLNVLSGAKTALDPIASYFDGNGNFANSNGFLAKVGPVLEDDVFGRYKSPPSAATSAESGLRVAQLSFDWPFNPCGADCQEEWDSWNNSTFAFAGVIGETVKNGYGCAKTRGADSASCEGAVYNLYDLVFGHSANEEAKQSFVDCINKSSTCSPKLTGPNPAAIGDFTGVGEWVRYEIIFGNDASASGPLTYKYSGVHVNPEGGGGGKLLPGQEHTIYWYYECPQVDTTVTDTILIETNDPVRPSVSVPVMLECRAPDITDPIPNPLKLEASINETATGSFSFGNAGETDLTYTVEPISTTNGYVVGPTSGTVPPGGQATITIDVYCGSVAGTKTFSVFISSNDPDEGEKTTAIELKCVKPPPPDISEPMPKPVLIKEKAGNTVSTSFTFANEGGSNLSFSLRKQPLNYASSTVTITSEVAGSLAPGQRASVSVDVRCSRPTVPNDDTHKILILSNDPDEKYKYAEVQVDCWNVYQSAKYGTKAEYRGVGRHV